MNKKANLPPARPFPWKCGSCGQREVYPVEEEYIAEMVLDGFSYTVTVPALRIFRCRSCGETVLDTLANMRISQEFRKQIGLLFPEEIFQHRQGLGLSTKELASRLGISETNLSRWETGAQIQSPTSDKLLRVFFNFSQVREFLGELPGITPDNRFGRVPL